MIKGSPVETYLRGRCVELPHEVEDLRYHASCPMGKGVRTHAMIGLYRDVMTDEPRGIHRTALNLDGSKHPAGKKMLGGVSGAVLKLSPDEEVTTGLGLTEGIENALTLIAQGWRPVWAAGSAGAIAKFPVLDGVECLTIFSDNDDGGTGIAAARECAQRWRAAGKEVIIHQPPAGLDWNDVQQGVSS